MSRHITAHKARALAYQWHGGMSSTLYAFASSGLVSCQLALLSEIRKCELLAEKKTDIVNLRSLYRYARDCVARVPDTLYPFRAEWA